MADYIKTKSIIDEQENKLVFDHFDSEDAWKFGSFVVDKMRNLGIPIAISLRRLNGKIVFQYIPDGTSQNHVMWMDRKFNTVAMYEMSSLGADLDLLIKGQTFADNSLDKMDYVACGGGFPIRVKGSGIAMVFIVSKLPHLQDHEFIVNCLSEYLNIQVPHIDVNDPIPMAK